MSSLSHELFTWDTLFPKMASKQIPKKIEAIKKWPVPKTVTEVQSFLGFTNYYRKFIPKYAQIARSINRLVSGENANKKKALVDWTEECQIAFEHLKHLCSQTSI